MARRPYCDQIVTVGIEREIAAFLAQLREFEQRAKERKAKGVHKKRYVCGLHQIFKAISANKVKCVIMAPNIDDIRSAGALNEMVNKLFEKCAEKEV